MEALQVAGFVIADVRTLDKKQGTFKQVTAAGAVKQDLVISAYKPNGGLVDRFKLIAGTKEGVWDFVRAHLKQLPVFVSKNGQAEVIVGQGLGSDQANLSISSEKLFKYTLDLGLYRPFWG